MKIDELINRHYGKLNDNDLLIWDYISRNRKECEKLAIDQLAFRCNVSRTTVLRFAQKLSLTGYSELKVYLKMDNEIPEEDWNNIDKVCRVHQELAVSMREKDCTAICQGIDQAERLFVYGTGMIQEAVQKEIKRIFLSAGKVFYDIRGVEELHAVVQGITDKDFVIIASLSGQSEHVIRFARELKVRNVPILSITKLKENELSRMSAYNLYISTARIYEEITNISYESVTAYLFIVELLFLKYVEYCRIRGIDHED